MQAVMNFIAHNVELFLLIVLLAVFVLSRLSRIIDGALALFGYVIFAAFLLYLVITLPQIDLSIVVIGTLALAGIDFWKTVREGNNGNGNGTQG